MILSVLNRGVATKSTPTPKMSGATKSTVTKTTSQGSSNVVFVAPAVKKSPAPPLKQVIIKLGKAFLWEAHF